MAKDVLKDNVKPTRKATTAKKAVQTPEQTPEQTAPAKRYIYAGASIPGSVKKYTVIEGEIPEALDRPFVKNLVVPVESFGELKKKLSVTGSFEAYCYRESVKYANKLAK